MTTNEPTDAELLDQIRASIRPIRDGNGPFRDDPSDIAWRIRDDALPNIEAGQAYITEITLPYLESEAVDKIRARTSYRPVVEVDRRENRELWRQKWVCEALAAEAHLQGIDPIAQAAVRVLLTAARLRGALETNDNPQKIAALSMLLGCAVFEGGYMLEAEATTAALKAAKASKKNAFIAGAGKNNADLKRARDGAVAYAKKTWSAKPDMRIGAMADAILSLLVLHKDKFQTLEAFPKANTIKTWLRNAGADGDLIIPAAAQAPGIKKSPAK